MLGTTVTTALEDLNQIKGLVRGFQTIRETGVPYGFESEFLIFPGVAAGQLRLFEHCTTIIRVYTVFERLVCALAEGWLGWLLRNNAEVVLSNKNSRLAYEMGMAEIFRRQAEPRFADVDRFSIAKSHSLFGTKEVTLRPLEMKVEPFFATYPNLQINHICTLFSNVAMGSPEEWLKASPVLLSLREEYSMGYSEALKDVVQRRNEVAHGNPDPGQLLGTNDLIARIESIAELGVSLYQYVLSAVCALELGNSYNKGFLGDVTRTWPKSQAFELVVKSSALALGEPVLVLEKSIIFLDVVKSIQIEGQATTGFCGALETPLGIRLNRLPKPGAKILRAAALRDLNSLLDQNKLIPVSGTGRW